MSFQRNRGFGKDGRGGLIADSQVGSFPGANDARNLSTQGSKPTPPAVLPITTAGTTNEVLTDVAKYIFKSAVDNTISCNVVSIVDQDEVESGTRVNIAKPVHLRKQEVDTDGEEVNGEIVTYAPDELLNLQGTRKREFESNGGTVTIFEKVDPPYTADETIFAANVQATGVAGIRFQDLNVQARRWVNIEPTQKYFAVELIHRDTLKCVEWDYATKAPKLGSNGVVLPSVEVAKAHSLRGTIWSSVHNGGSENPDGVDYTTDGTGDTDTDEHKDRFADDDSNTEDQEVIPPWFNTGNGVWVTVIRAVRVDAGTGAFFDGAQSIWQDTNDDGRAFTVKFA
jgi:hypothetical protein